MSRRLLLSGLALLLTVLLTWILQDFVRETLVDPILYIIWIVQLAVGMLSQALIWAVFLLIFLFLAIRSLWQISPAATKTHTPETRRRGRVGVWQRWIDLASRDRYSKWRLARHLGDLSVDVLAHESRLTPEEVREQVSAGQLTAKPEVLNYLSAAVSTQTLRDYITLDERRFGTPTSRLDIDLEQIAQFLEAQLEVSRGR